MASGPITSWQIEGEKVEAVTDFIFLSFGGSMYALNLEDLRKENSTEVILKKQLIYWKTLCQKLQDASNKPIYI